MVEAPGALPVSPLLSEARPDSLSDYFNRDPLELKRASPEAFKKVVAELRAQVERIALASANGAKVPKAVRAEAAGAAKAAETSKSSAELDL